MGDAKYYKWTVTLSNCTTIIESTQKLITVKYDSIPNEYNYVTDLLKKILLLNF